MMKYIQRVIIGLVLVLAFGLRVAGAEPYLVSVNGEVVGADEYVYIARKAIREKFYHGSIPESELKTYKRELLDGLVDEYLLSAEARKRGLVAAEGVVRSGASGQDAAVASDAAAVRAMQLVVADAQRKDLVEKLKQQVIADSQPGDAKVRAYYEANLDKFIRPEQKDVSVILVGVDPSSSAAVWDKALEKAAALKAEVLAGGSFEELAEIHSSDVSASAGGAMGLLHRGLLGDEAENVLAEMSVGDLSDPQVVLDGVVLFRLNARIEAQQLSFDEVKPRATSLSSRQEGELSWDALMFRLRSQAEIVLNDSLLKEMDI